MPLENYDLLSSTEKARVEALPYRVGLWLSTLDHGGGDLADEIEGLALVHAIEAISRNSESPFAAYICRQTLLHRGGWLSWSENLAQVPEEAQAAVQDLARRIPSEDVDEYRVALFQIAVRVARAYRERDLPESSGVSSFVGRLLGRESVSEVEMDTALNISPLEKRALFYLAEMMALPETMRLCE